MKKMLAQPLFFEPMFKEVIWGGTELKPYKGLAADDLRIGESWELSAVPGSESRVAEGLYRGMTISELAETFGEQLLGRRVVRLYGKKFPLLVKLIDAQDDLSVQVHPNDELAAERHDSPGKTEMWYIIDSKPGAKIYAGLNRPVSPKEFARVMRSDRAEQLLAEHDSAPGDVFFLPAGRVHAIGAGNMLAEIQESSDITYRLYDYNRTDAQGRPRQLHIDEAMDAVDLTFHDNYRTHVEGKDDDIATLVDCSHFLVSRVIAEPEVELPQADDSFRVVMCLDGDVRLNYFGGEAVVRRGQTVLLPAVMGSVTATALSGKALLLTAQAPTAAEAAAPILPLAKKSAG